MASTTNLTFIEKLETNCANFPQKTAFIFKDYILGDTPITYSDLMSECQSLCKNIAFETRPGDRVIIIVKNRLYFARAFIATMLAHCVPVPVPPDILCKKNTRNLDSIATSSESVLVITDLQLDTIKLPIISPYLVDTLTPPPAPKSTVPSVDTAFIQYTSGTTGAPKGIPITQRNLSCNLEIIRQAFGHSEDLVGVNWLPFHHDMGLVGNLLQPLWVGGTCIHIKPQDFVKKPRRWLEAISEYRATTSGGTSFGYELATKHPPDSTSLNLSSWRTAYVGADIVRRSTLTSFASYFKKIGFDPQSFYPCYGLAESTLMVTGATERQPLGIYKSNVSNTTSADFFLASSEYVSCGSVFENHDLKILDHDNAITADLEVGHIYISGPSLFKGYLDRFDNHGKFIWVDGVRYFRTGDIGFMHQGELYPVGRSDDVLSINGKKFSAHALELLISEYLSLDLSEACLVHLIEQSKVRAIIELKKGNHHLSSPKSESLVKSLIARRFGISVSSVIFVNRGTIPRTTSGKIRRNTDLSGYADINLEST